MVETALRRKERENPYKGIALPDTIRKQTKNQGLSNILHFYENLLTKEISGSFDTEEFVHSPTFFLTPEQIDIFLQSIIPYHEDKNYYHTRIFIANLIQQSFNKGNNDFNLNTQRFRYPISIGDYLTGEEGRKMKINILGDVDYIGGYSKECSFFIDGNVGDSCGNMSMYCDYTIKGSTGNFLAIHSGHSKYHVHKNIGALLGTGAVKNEYIIEGDVKDSPFNVCVFSKFLFKGKINGFRKIGETESHQTFGNTIKTTHEEDYHKILENICENNHIILIDNNSKVIKEHKK